MFGGKVKIRKQLLAQVKNAAEEAGCSSVEEFVESAIEKELERFHAGKKGNVQLQELRNGHVPSWDQHHFSSVFH